MEGIIFFVLSHYLVSHSICISHSTYLLKKTKQLIKLKRRMIQAMIEKTLRCKCDMLVMVLKIGWEMRGDNREEIL